MAISQNFRQNKITAIRSRFRKKGKFLRTFRLRKDIIWSTSNLKKSSGQKAPKAAGSRHCWASQVPRCRDSHCWPEEEALQRQVLPPLARPRFASRRLLHVRQALATKTSQSSSSSSNITVTSTRLERPQMT